MTPTSRATPLTCFTLLQDFTNHVRQRASYLTSLPIGAKSRKLHGECLRLELGEAWRYELGAAESLPIAGAGIRSIL